jgi:cathepsin L
LILAALGVAFANPLIDALNAQHRLTQFEDFKKTFQKTYATPEEEIKRLSNFITASEFVEQHNKEEELDGRHGFTTAINEFADLSNEEFVKLYNNYKMKPRTGENPTFLAPENVQLPESIDWRTKGYVTGVKNQGQCGSCWSFSATGSLEGQHFRKTGKLVSLSEQNLVDCSGKQGNEGCNGGFMDYAFNYIQQNKGIDTEASYPYTARDGTCKFNANNVGATVAGHKDIPSKDENALKAAVGTVGPISVAIDASHFSFQLYSKGVYNERQCSQTALDHGVLAVGYGTAGKKDYWLVKNSWGPSWGMKGYIQMTRNKNNQCGIATDASYPLV